MTSIEQDIENAGLVAPRITPEDVESNIVSTDYHIFPGSQLTVCCVTLQNGFTVTGESACASPENFNVVIGRKIARANAVDKIWPLMGYELKTRLSQ